MLFRFLLAFMVYMAGLEAVIKFVGIYARSELHFGMDDIRLLFIVLQLSAAAGAFAFGLVGVEKWLRHGRNPAAAG